MTPRRIFHAIPRLLPVLQVSACLLLALAGLTVLGIPFFASDSAPLWMAETLNPDERQRLRKLVIGAEVFERGQGAARHHIEVLIMGLSTAREGFDTGRLETFPGVPGRAVNLGSSGGSFRELDFYTRDLERTSLQPGTVLLGVHAAWLAGRRPEARAPLTAAAWRSLLAKGRPDPNLCDCLKQAAWFHHGYRRIHNSLHNGLSDLGLRLHPTEGLAPLGPSDDPFRTQNLYQGPKADPAFFPRQWAEIATRGWFDAERYTEAASADEEAALRSLLHRCQRLAPQVLVVLLPESERFRNQVPPLAAARLIRIIESTPGARFMDCRAVVPAFGFYDHLHVNADGRRILTDLIGRHLP